jgi:hypothetical protein
MKCLIFNLSASYSYKKNKCRCAACKEWKKDAAERTNDKELAKERSKTWRLNNLERSRSNSISYQKRFPRKVLEWKLKKYNMTLEDFDLMLAEQKGVCKICGKNPKGMQNSRKHLCVDHDHKTGKVRGLLCGSCNVALGLFGHGVELLKNSIVYLEGTGKGE